MIRYPLIEINLYKIEHNVRTINKKCIENNIELVGVSKAVCGCSKVAMAFLNGGVSKLGDSRVDNIIELKENGVSAEYILIRTPMLSEVKKVVQEVDISFNSELEVIKALSEECQAQDITHEILLMVETGDLREGEMPDNIVSMVEEILKLKGIKLIGIGTNLACLCGVVPSSDNLGILPELQNKILLQTGVLLPILSGANSSSITDILSNRFPQEINQIRIGEGILLGKETIYRNNIPNTYQDTFVLKAEIIELKWKPSLPIGDISQNAFGKSFEFEDRGEQLRAILALGKLDVDTDAIKPVNEDISIIGSNSDHFVLDLTNCSGKYKIGDHIDFLIEYSALITVMSSKYIPKIYI